MVIVASPQAAAREQWGRALQPLVQSGAVARLGIEGDARAVLTLMRASPPNLLILDAGLIDSLIAVLQVGGIQWAAFLSEPPAGKRIIGLPTPNRDGVENIAAQIRRLLQQGAVDVFTPPHVDELLCSRVERLLELRTAKQSSNSGERQWQALFENSRAPQLIVDAESSRILEINRAAINFYGYDPARIRTMTLADLEVRDEQAGAGTLFNFRQRLSDGSVADVKLFSTPFDYRGALAFHQIVQDNSKRRRAEDSERRERIFVTALRNTTTILLNSFDRDDLFDRILQYVQANVSAESINIKLIEDGAARIVRSRGYREDDGLDHAALIIRDTPNLQWVVENNRPFISGNVLVYDGWRRDHAWTWIRSHISVPIRADGEMIGFLCVDSPDLDAYTEADADRLQAMADQVAIALRNLRLYEQTRDLAAQLDVRVRQRTAELHAEREQLRAILDSMTEGVILTAFSKAGRPRTRYINQAIMDMLGLPADYFFHSVARPFQPVESTRADFHRVLREMLARLQEQRVFEGEITLQRRGGGSSSEPLDVHVTLTRVDNAEGQMAGIVTVMRDIQQEKALQAERSRFVAFASHELRTPITNLKTRLYLLKRQPEKMAEHAEIMGEVVERMKRLVDDLLDINRFEHGQIEIKQMEKPLNPVVRAAVESQRPEAERAGLSLMLIENELLTATIDDARIMQVIINLLTNAINYTAGGGSIRVRVGRMMAEDGLQMAAISVEDSGIGITPEHLPRLFSPFYRVPTAVTGTGLGLTIAREIARLHGGEILVASEPGVGSRFTLLLPLTQITPMQADGETAR